MPAQRPILRRLLTSIRLQVHPRAATVVVLLKRVANQQRLATMACWATAFSSEVIMNLIGLSVR